MKSINRIAVLSGLTLGAFAISALAAGTWTPACGPAPTSAGVNCNALEPINVGNGGTLDLQTRNDSLQVNGNLGVTGSILLNDGTVAPAQGSVLTAKTVSGNVATLGWVNSLPIKTQGWVAWLETISDSAAPQISCQGHDDIDGAGPGTAGIGNCAYNSTYNTTNVTCDSGYQMIDTIVGVARSTLYNGTIATAHKGYCVLSATFN